MNILFLSLSIGFFTFLSAALLFSLNRKSLLLDQRISRNFHLSEASASIQGKEVQKKSNKPFSHLWSKGIKLIGNRTPKSKQKKLDLLLRDAGFSGKMTALEFRLLQLLISGGSGALVFLLVVGAEKDAAVTWLLSSAVSFLLFQYCTFYLSKRRTRRIAEINRDMPDFFDTVNLLIEAGLGLDAALMSVCHKKKSPLSDEFKIVLEEMKRGKSRRESFYELRMRVPSDGLQRALTTMIQADHLGVGMSKVIRNLTIRLREQRRESAREQAMKAPVKMLFPMVFFIFPAIFIVSLGPLVIKILTEGLM
ncbi:type II secretion system F family protein [Rossellomorea sp. NS-SX7]|uniref:type II secretion system F family protein n=1 Tax=Rossellomorea sp. NS-SX7 TaxID=3463856 RepID=UPI004057DB78